MKPTSTIRNSAGGIVPALLGISLTLGSIGGIHTAYAVPEIQVDSVPAVVVITPPPVVVATTTPKRSVPPPAVPVKVVAAAPPIPSTITPQPSSTPTAPTAVPKVKKKKAVTTPSRRTRAS